MSDTEAILAMIDGALADVTSPDAMRWTPDPSQAGTTEADLVQQMFDLPNRLAQTATGPAQWTASHPLTVADLQRAHDALAESSWGRLADLIDPPACRRPPDAM